MKKISSFKNMSFSRKIVLKRKLKTAAVACASCILAAASVITASMIFVYHRDSTGQGGHDIPFVPVSAESLEDTFNQVQESTESTFFSSLLSAAGLTDLRSDEMEASELALLEDVDSLDVDEFADFDLSYCSYRVKKGDAISLIAERYGVTEDTIISVNNIQSSRLLQIGQYLKIPSMPGILYKTQKTNETAESVAEKFKVNATKCLLANNLKENEEIGSGRTIFVPDAKMDRTTRLEINGDLFKKPLRGHYRLTSYYGYRTNPFDSSRRTFHTGIDMACPQGTPIYAALEGTVTTAGYNNVYGNYVIITHHSGYKTLYGHMSKILVKTGTYATTSTRLGLVGSTGMSTGPHLHFTVYKNNRTINPLKMF